MFYEILQEIMDEKELNIPDVARASSLSDSTIRSIISRRSKTVALEVAFKISKGLDVSLERLIGENENNVPIVKNKDLFSCKECAIIKAYRSKPDMQYAVDKLLGIDEQFKEEYGNDFMIEA